LYKHSKYALLGLALAAGIAACTSGQSAQVPAFQSANLSADVALLAVGVATFGNGSTGTNLVATFRQPNGDSATLVNTPTVTGPAAWIIPSCTGAAGSCTNSTGLDAGTNHLSASVQIPNGVISPTPTPVTLAQTNGVFSYGILPDNVSTSGAPVFSVNAQPFFALVSSPPVAQRSYRGGPPAYPQVRDGTYPSGFFGYSQGFLTLLTPAVAGTYNLSVLVQTSTGASTTFSANGSMASTTPLGVIGPASVVQDGAGGMTINFTAPAGVTETEVDVQDLAWCANATVGVVYYTVRVTGAGAQSAVLPANLGPTGGSANTCATPGRTIIAGDSYAILLVGADYPLFAAGPPQNVSQSPTLNGAGGQADITLSTRQTFAY
jgi:hypothetical protein